MLLNSNSHCVLFTYMKAKRVKNISVENVLSL